MKALFCRYSFTIIAIVSLGHTESKNFLNRHENFFIKNKSEISIFVEPNIHLYTYTHENHFNGYAIEYLRLLGKKLGIPFRFVTHISRAEAKEMLQKGELDIALFPISGAFDEHMFQLSRFPIGVLHPALLFPKIYQFFPRIQSFENLTLATTQEDRLFLSIKEKNPDSHIIITESLDQAILMVLKQEVDFAVGTHESFEAFMESKMLNSLQSTPLYNNLNFPLIPIHLVTSRENLLLISIINKTMAIVNYDELLELRKRFFSLRSLRQTDIVIPATNEEKLFLASKNVLTFCTLPNNMPYSDIQKNGYLGFGVEVVSLLETYLDIPVQLLPTKTREESYKNLLERKCDFITPESAQTDTSSFMRTNTALFTSPLVVVTASNQPYVADFQEIQHKSFLILEKHPMKSVLLKNFPNIQLKTTDSEVEGLRLIEKGQYYGLITQNLSVPHLFQNIISNNLKVSSQLPFEVSFGFVTLKDNRTMHSLLEKASSSFLKNDMSNFIKNWVPRQHLKGFDHLLILQSAFLFILFSAIAFKVHFKTSLQNKRLREAKNSLDTLNRELESRIAKEVRLSREKDMVMYRQSRFASMGEMIGNIAHQWRQPLMELSALLMDLYASAKFNPRVKKREIYETISSSNHVIQFMSQTINDFKNFFSPEKEMEVFSINKAIEESANIMRATLGHHKILLNIDAIGDEAMALGFKNEYAQAIINIISNANDILTERAVNDAIISITIETDRVGSRVAIEDNGGGISKFHLDKVFDPFFSKKERGGTGIGLFMSKMIIENHMNGNITAENTTRGAKFCIWTPKIK